MVLEANCSLQLTKLLFLFSLLNMSSCGQQLKAKVKEVMSSPAITLPADKIVSGESIQPLKRLSSSFINLSLRVFILIGKVQVIFGTFLTFCCRNFCQMDSSICIDVLLGLTYIGTCTFTVVRCS